MLGTYEPNRYLIFFLQHKQKNHYRIINTRIKKGIFLYVCVCVCVCVYIHHVYAYYLFNIIINIYYNRSLYRKNIFCEKALRLMRQRRKVSPSYATWTAFSYCY